jgi:hypothetical protein
MWVKEVLGELFAMQKKIVQQYPHQLATGWMGKS